MIEGEDTQPLAAEATGEGSGRRERVDRREAICNWVDTMLPQARQTIHLVTPDLEGWLYDRGQLVDALRQQIIRQRRLHCKILLRDPRSALIRGHRLVALARRLPDFFAIRRIAQEFSQRSECYLVIDRRAVLYRPESDQLEGWADPDAPADAVRLLDRFEEVWQPSLPEPEFRELRI